MLKTCPEYRLPLFLSIDLAGSTEYKAKNNSRESNLYPLWVNTITKGFYDAFPAVFEVECKELKLDNFPKIWKKIGDEIIFCNRIVSEDHFKNCILAFKKALSKYRDNLKQETSGLDIKDAAWVASFPFPNLSLTKEINKDDMYTSEEMEGEIDKNPDEYDFLGQAIDTGFRVAKSATSDKMYLCLETAYLLFKIIKNKENIGDNTPFSIAYHGKEVLKGVLGGKPYPLFFIHTNINREENELNKSEDKLLKRKRFIDLDDAVLFLDNLLTTKNLLFLKLMELVLMGTNNTVANGMRNIKIMIIRKI